MKTMSRKLGAKGWLSLSWPKEYGGQNSLFLQTIVYEEVLYHNCPGINPMGVSSLINSYRSESQKVMPGKARSRHWLESSRDIQFERMAAPVDMVTEWSDGSVRPSGQAWSVPGLQGEPFGDHPWSSRRIHEFGDRR
jgi:hypothetical protein